ncbi:uncharacterized protein HD556DRAFT_1018698 [Suillus plorans]|uniref:Uncharacterized protein n=1 Tax=Suillus plorans TaxID=116603 RepID=A0A9P7ACM6_9AGAM|nr:uncharacterized protein HD556DRAFT_1018698 [Suillus plorans]KAG1786693.1 hypothetical protein HD556DRAFT_1018698 [Suillus plorans]
MTVVFLYTYSMLPLSPVDALLIMTLILADKLSASVESEIDHLPPAYDTVALSTRGRDVPSIPAIVTALTHHDKAAPITSTVVTDVHEFEPPRSRLWANTLPRSRSNIDFITPVTQLPNNAAIPPVDVDKPLKERPQLYSRKTVPAESASFSYQTGKRKLTKARRAKSGSSSWLSFLPFSSSKTTKHDHEFMLTLIHDLIVPPPTNSGNLSPKSPQLALADPHEMLASYAQTCSAKNLSLSTLLQEPDIAGHTAIYWAIVNYRSSLLDALLKYASPLTPVTLSEMRKACLVASNQPLFHNLRLSVGLCASGLRSATDGLLLGQRPPDDVRVEEGPDGAFAATLDIAMWQKRMRAVGSVSVEFIVSGRIFALTFFTTDRPRPHSKSTKTKIVVGPLHVSLSLLDHSLPTYVDATVVIDEPPPLPSLGPCPRSPINSYSPRERIHSANFSGRETMYGFENEVGSGGCETDFNYDGQAQLPSPSSLSPPAVVLHFSAGESMLACRTRNGDSYTIPHATTKPDTWSEHGAWYVSAIVVPLGEQDGAGLMFDTSPHITPDGSLRARLEARLVKTEEGGKKCIIC